MKISNDQVRKALEGYVRQAENRRTERAKNPESKSGAASHKTDSVTITTRSVESKKAIEHYRELPDVRRELVEELKGKIKSGSYEVTSKEVADKVIHRMVVDKTV